MNELQWIGAFLQFLLWIAPIVLLARIAYSISPLSEGRHGLFPLISAGALTFLSMLFGTWWYNRLEFYFSEWVLICHAIETVALILVFWAGRIVLKKLERGGQLGSDRIASRALVPTVASGVAVFASSVWFVFIDGRTLMANLDLVIYTASFALLAALFVALGFVSGAVPERPKGNWHRLAYGAAVLILLSNVSRAYLFALHGFVPFAEGIKVGRELVAFAAAIMITAGISPAIKLLIGRARKALVETPFQRRKAETQKRLTIAFALLVLFLGALLTIMLESIHTDEQMIEKAHVQQQTKVARTLMVNVDSSLAQLSAIVQGFASDPAVQEMRHGSMITSFQRLPGSWDDEIMAIARIDSAGKLVDAYPEYGPITGRKIANCPHILYLLKHERISINTSFGTLRGNKTVAILCPVFSNSKHGKGTFEGGVGLIIADTVLSGRMFSNVSILNTSPIAAVNMRGSVFSESSGDHSEDTADEYLTSVYGKEISAENVSVAVGRILHASGLSLVSIHAGEKDTRSRSKLIVAAPLRVHGNHLGAIIVPVRSYVFAELNRHAVSNRVRLWSYLLTIFAGLTGVMMFVYHRWSGFLEGEVKRERDIVRETEGHYTKLFDSARLGIFRTDADGAFTAANPALGRMLGYLAPEKLLGKKLLHPGLLQSAAESDSGKSAEKEPLTLLTAYGVPVYIMLSCGAKRDDAGRLLGYEGFMEDVTESYLANEKVRDSERRYSELFKLSPAGIYVTTEEGKILEINDSFAAMFGYENTEELLRLPVSVLYSDSYPRERFLKELRKSGSVTHQVFAVKKKDGSSVYVYENAELMFDPLYDRSVIRGALMDVTELVLLQKQVELHRKVAETSSEVLAAAFQGGDVRSIIDKSIASMGKNLDLAGVLVLQRAEGAVIQNFQWWADHSGLDGGAELDVDAFEKAFSTCPVTCIFEGHEEGFEENMIAKTYGPRSFAVSKIFLKDQLWGYLVLLAAVPGRKWPFPERNFLESANKLLSAVVERDYESNLRVHLQEQRNELLFAFEQLAESVVVSDKNGIIRYVNSTFTKLTGFSREDVVGKSTEILRSEEHGEEFFKRLWDTIMSGNVFRARFKSRRKDGSIVYLDKTIAPVIDSKGEVVSFVEVANDITEQISLEEQLAQSQKMESVGLLAGGIAHDFNNIIGAILGYASLMKGKLTDTHEFYRYVDTIERSATRAAELTSQLLAFARGGKYNVVPVDINRIASDTLRIIRSTFDRSIVLETDFGERLSSVEADPGQMQQVVMNLCVNARDAMPRGGILRLFTGELELSEKETASNVEARPGRYVFLSVSDTGIGMDKATVKRIFEPFFTTKEKGKGTGLGLSMVYGIVRNHGGFIDVESEPGKGTTFKVYYPASGKGRKEEKEDRIMSKSKGGTETVLVAEDEPSVRELVNDILQSGGYNVIAVCDGEEAIRTYVERKDEIDLVILDMIMPKLSGGETFRRLKAIDKDVRVLLSSGYSEDEQARQLLADGVAGFLGKPYQVDEFLDKVRLVLEMK